MEGIVIEACVENLEHALNSEAKGANRIELCSNLAVEGLTPSENLIRAAKEALDIPIRVMIRPRAGDFCYSQDELAQMRESIRLCKKIGVEGVVFGILNMDNTLNVEVIKSLAKESYPLKVVIHKAIDSTPDPVASLKQLLEIEEITTVLTSGGKDDAFEGADILKEMIQLAGDEIEILAQGHITRNNFDELHELIGAQAYHGKYIVTEI
ncbi:copper homeostasis protein CutC [Gramella sp. KN1008]|uniref:copper homeostasis protein CutC n=1 Tax=Gramella sp. KN1008 TaxID=2529298 RepID=UPI00103E9785|nr:copper homeostasis protein CutC [Gramella sp. KN1008]TBW28634.1 copper homeostasis protein CutC [Gramella sp. KN1008]